MKRTKLDWFMSLRQKRSVQFLIGLGVLYLLMVVLEVPFVSKIVSQEGDSNGFLFTDNISRKPYVLDSEEELQEKEAPIRPVDVTQVVAKTPMDSRKFDILSNLNFDVNSLSGEPKDGFGDIQKSATEAFSVGKRFWEELESGKLRLQNTKNMNKARESCPNSITLSGSGFREEGSIIVLPCGMTLGSHVTVVGRAREAHPEQDPKISLLKSGQYLMVSQFMMELQGLKTVDEEDPPRILHFNPRLKGD